MPHIIVKLWPGKTEAQKQDLTRAITESTMKCLGSKEASISVAFEEVPSEEWTAKVYEPDIENGPGKLYKKPGYTP